MTLKISKKSLIIIAGFLFSFVHWIAYAFFLLGLLFYRKERISGNIKALLLIATRTVIGPAVAAPIGSAQIIKWLVIFLLSFDILYHTRPFQISDKEKKRFVAFLGFFVVSNLFTLIISSSYPTVALFKLVSYTVPFYAILNGIEHLENKVDWIQYIIDILTPVMLACFVAIPFSNLRVVNGDFQGIIEHPNMMGIIAAIYIGLLVYKISTEQMTLPRASLVCLSFVLIYLSKSRTGMFSALIFCAIALILCTRMDLIEKFIGTGIIAGVIAALLFINEDWMAEITRFFYKRETTDVFDSRRIQEVVFHGKFDNNKLLGTGFMVPYSVNYQSLKLSFDVSVESGNLVFAVLGDSGIIGAIAFLGYLITVFVYSDKAKRMLIFIPIVLSMGEMAFFSTNNIALIYYVIIGVCFGSMMQKGDSNEGIDYRK